MNKRNLHIKGFALDSSLGNQEATVKVNGLFVDHTFLGVLQQWVM